jgi:SAM-dependent methyltransferase
MPTERNGTRHWQNWDRPGVTQAIDEYWLQSPLEAAVRAEIAADVAECFDPKTDALYEVGCGSGLIGLELRKRGFAYAGGDVSAEMRKIGEQRLGQTLDAIDVLDLKGSRENVLCIHVLQHLPDFREAIEQLCRFATRRLYVVTWGQGISCSSIHFSEPAANPGKAARFFDNTYSLGALAGAMGRATGRRIDARYISGKSVRLFC